MSECDYTDYELLKFAKENGMIDMHTIYMQKLEMDREEALKTHNYPIWQGSTNSLWYTYLPDATKERGKKLVKRKSEKDIKEAIFKFYNDKKHSKNNKTMNNVFYEWSKKKIEYNEICKGTYDRYLNDYGRFFESKEIGNMKIKDISEDYLEEFVKKTISECHLTTKSYSNMKTLLIGVFKYAKHMNYTDISINNFLKDLEISRRSFTKKSVCKELQVFKDKEIPLILNYIYEHPTVQNLGILLVFQTGIRSGELAALKFSDIEGNQMHIQRTEIKYKGDGKRECIHEIADHTKTDAGDRYIILTDSALKTIELIKRSNPVGEYVMQIGYHRILSNSYNDILYRICDECHIPRRSMHKIRKTYGTTLIDGGVDESLVMLQMGHKDITTTKKYYYFSNKGLDSKVDQIKKAINF